MIASQEHATIITFLLPKTQCSFLEVHTLEALQRFDAHGFCAAEVKVPSGRRGEIRVDAEILLCLVTHCRTTISTMCNV
jgi:hypothetical protein